MGKATIVCAQCKRITPRTGQRQTFCAECAAARKRASGAERERQRRAERGDQIRARDRERYATDPSVRQQKKDSASARYLALKEDPATYAAKRSSDGLAMARHRERTVYGGNRQAALRRDDHQCQQCGARLKPRLLHIHHIDGKGSLVPVEQQNNNLDNLTTLCAACHAKVHREREATARAERTTDDE